MPNAEIARARLHNQRIAKPTFDDPAAIVRWMGAMQAQDYHQAVWALGARLAVPTLQAVEAALTAGQIIRTWPMRGTIHFVPPEDALWMLRLTATRMIAKDGRRQRQLELDGATLARCETVIEAALRGGRSLSRPDLLQTLETAGISTTGQRGYHILAYLAQRGLIYIGALEGKQQTFALLDDVAPHPRNLTTQEAWVELARRYFGSHNPATSQDFAWWAGVTLTEARAAIESLRPAVQSEMIDGVTYWHSETSAGRVRPAATPEIVLLPGFDEYFLGYKDRAAVIEPEHLTRVCPGGNGVFRPMIVVDGQIVGTWTRTFKKDSVIIEPTRFPDSAPIDADALSVAAGRYANFHGLVLKLA
ncbi:MAG: winged helix DNA-binding domain-containing protein [Chloroflexota bacterium]|nr:winged helix DNA-binding domain-containing protein [Chloroflexota bacterium]